MAGPGRLARLVTLFREDASLVECILWLKNVYLRRLENKPGMAELEKNVLALLNHGSLLPDGVNVDHVDSEGLWTRRNDVVLPLDDMSDGYRAVIALVLDLAMQLHTCFDGLQVESAGGSLTVPFEGVVLIDEIDAHLHPSWQKRIGFWLKEHFPNLQFIVTTHSPFICQAADPKGLIRLPAPGSDERAQHVTESVYNLVVNGSAEDAIMSELFGREKPYSDAAEALRAEISALEARVIRGEATTKEKAHLKTLRAKLPTSLSAQVEDAVRKLAVRLDAKDAVSR